MWRPWNVQESRFNFEECLKRLHEASELGFLHLTDVAVKIYKQLPPFKIPTTVSSPKRIDRLSQDYLREFKMQDLGVPYHVKDNGSCLFNAVSVDMTGTETLATELRVRTCIEMARNQAIYTSLPNAKDFLWVSPNYVLSTMDCARPRGWSSIWTIYALAEVIGITIKSVYPPVNGVQDMSYKVLNLEAEPQICRNPNDKVTVLWTRTTQHFGELWYPNHFVPLILQLTDNLSTDSSTDPPPLNDDAHFPPLSGLCPPNYHSSPVKTEKGGDRDRDQPVNVSDQADISEIKQNNEPRSTSVTQEVVNTNMKSLPTGGLEAHYIYKLVNQTDCVLDEIPLGYKSNCFVLINNATNTERIRTQKASRFYDDLGAWDSSKGTTVKTNFIKSLGFKCVYIRNGEYCLAQGKKRSFVPMNPQPEHNDVVVMNRYYATLKRQSDFKKRVTWFTSSSNDEISKVACVEYIGRLKAFENTHGNSKKEKAPYKRTNPKVLDKAAAELLVKKPRQVYKEMIIEDERNAPKDMQQLRDLKSYNTKKQRPYSAGNVADEILDVLNMLLDNDFVQKVDHTRGQIPSIILYTDDQMTSFRKYLEETENPHVGIDRTFNLGSFFVTSFNYKNNRVVRKDSSDHPIFLGPLLLHKEAGFDKYHSFLSFVRSNIVSEIKNVDLVLPKSIAIGSDDEKALTKAIDSVFPDAKRSLCTKHLKDNVSDYLRNKIGVKTPDRMHIIDKIFGQAGILNSEDEYQFEERCAQMTILPDNSSEFITYFNRTLRPKLLLNFQNLGKERTAHIWTNNNAESLHNTMKIDINWKPQSTPDLINTLHDMVKLQMLDLQRSLYNSGNYRLYGVYRRFLIREDIFRAKTETDQMKYFTNFVKYSVAKKRLMTSSNGQYSIPKKARDVAKKPSQRKRPVNAKTSKKF